MIENDVQEPLETYHVYSWGDSLLIRKEEEPFIDSTPVKQPRDNHTLIMMSVCSCVMALFILFIPTSPITQQITLVHAFSIPRDVRSFTLPPVTRSESRTIVTTGIGHTAATYAHGYLTLYNGSFTQQDIPANMIFRAGSVEIVTDAAITIPEGNPPTYGQATISAHALNAGVAGNIRPYQVDQQCCFSAVKAINETPFYGGRDARDYRIVTKQDIKTGEIPLQPLYALTPDDTLIRGDCSIKFVASRHAGEEATSVKVSTFETCSGTAFSKKSLAARAQKLISIPRDFRMTRLSVTVVRTTPTSVLASIQYTTVYSFSQKKEWTHEN
jgi:hypothetical protein